MSRPKIVLGLGNPGERYRGTRHNLGFRVVERFAAVRGVRFGKAAGSPELAWTATAPAPGGTVVLAMPRTFMNRSGAAAAALCRDHDAEAGELLVVYDDADLELGRVRLRPGGGAGGHNGLGAILDTLGTDRIPRVKLGVRGAGRDEVDLADYVLSDFAPAEEPVADRLVGLGLEAVEAVLRDGLPTAMNRYNARSVSETERSDRSEEEG